MADYQTLIREGMSPEDVAKECGVQLSTVYTWLSRKKFPSYKIGSVIKVKRKDFEVFYVTQYAKRRS